LAELNPGNVIQVALVLHFWRRKAALITASKQMKKATIRLLYTMKVTTNGLIRSYLSSDRRLLVTRLSRLDSILVLLSIERGATKW
jgi:hypothetical protein